MATKTLRGELRKNDKWEFSITMLFRDLKFIEKYLRLAEINFGDNPHMRLKDKWRKFN